MTVDGPAPADGTDRTAGVGLADVVDLVDDGATIGVGGVGMSRKPIAMLQALVRAGVTDLTVVSFLGSLDVELLLAAGAVARLHTAGVSLEAAGLAPCYRRARQEGGPTVIEWGEGSLHAAIEAGARGVPFLPTITAAGSDVVATNPDLLVVADPFDGDDVVVARALPIDVALLHVPAATADGELFVAGDTGIDDVLVRAADRVVVSTDAVVERPASEATIQRLWVDHVVELPGGSWPTACHPTASGRPAVARRWAAAPEHSLDDALELSRGDALDVSTEA